MQKLLELLDWDARCGVRLPLADGEAPVAVAAAPASGKVVPVVILEVVDMSVWAPFLSPGASRPVHPYYSGLPVYTFSVQCKQHSIVV